MVFQVGKIVTMITGGGRGLGRAIAEHFVKQGGRVSILDHPQSGAEEVVDELGADACTFCPCDVRNADDVSDAVMMTVRQFGGIHALVNCAGFRRSLGIYNVKRNAPHQLELFENMLETNVTGTFNVIRLTVPEMVKNEPDGDGQRGVIVNTSSIAGLQGERGEVAYATCMAAINAMTLPLARDLKYLGIRISAIAPGYISSPMFDDVPQEVKDFIISQMPFPTRFGIPKEYVSMAETIIENSYINGEVIRLDGGIRPAF